MSLVHLRITNQAHYDTSESNYTANANQSKSLLKADSPIRNNSTEK